MPAEDMLPRNGRISAESSYGHRSKDALALVQKLRALGAQADLDLPRIAVIGNQSAGKSSLVEAISGITVPRDAGTCTRCPMECRMTHSPNAWRCRIYIRWEFDETGQRLDEVSERPFGDAITDKTQVEPMLRRAQAAVLYPHVDPATILTSTMDRLSGQLGFGGKKPLLFSKNAVCIDLAGPELTDLSFVDLPGIIQNADPHTVQLVESLVTSHITGNCLILITLPMSDDIENQKAARLAKEADPSGLRTIGVLTKPDTLAVGSTKLREAWLELIEGRSDTNRLVHGYFCTRQPDDAERAAGITHAQARIAETEFFSSTPPWSSSSHQHRFGTANLVSTLSNLLIKYINEALPKLQTEVSRQLTKYDAELSQLPPPVTTEPSAYVLGLVAEFCKTVQAYIVGGPTTASLVQENRQAYATFKRRIRSTAPPFLPYPSPQECGPDSIQYLQIDDERDDDNVVHSGSGAATFPPNSMYLLDMKKYIRQSVTRELPYNVPYSAKMSLIQDFQDSWERLSRETFEKVYQQFDSILTSVTHKEFSQYAQLQARINAAVQEILKIRKKAALTYLINMLQLEKTPFTQNDHYLASKASSYLARYKDARAGKTTAKTNSGSRGTSIFGDPAHQARGDQDHAFSSFTFAVPKSTSSATAPATCPASGRIFGGGAQSGSSAPRQSAPSSFSGFSSSQSSSPSLPSPFAPISTASSAVDAKARPASTASSNNTPQAGSGSFGPGSSQKRDHSQSGFGAHSTSVSVDYANFVKSPFVPPASSTAQPVLTSAETLPFAAQPAPEADLEEREKLQKEALALLTKLGYTGLEVEDLGKLNPPDEFEEELEVMAEVRAYFHVAYKRIIDYVPLCIDHMFLYNTSNSLQAFLIEKLGLGSSKAAERCAAYLAENPNIVAVRKELMAKKERLESVQVELDNFGL
ncbi:uncharacterized protein LAESUDRAFT_811749 [Laetiporus sulphureus 93-53]|uniref:P-loop containing nucleoside triphosphate hydrolase protein n=1 Tax=Laetiporus sulphureus 93-53 TaxID=1314785 RepID=A0A165EW62_9APHY|nr:uncharacterized protein LAESUDRAFT_811749 [Laetiporus sulphureus 93-53]KZT07896.1 hypothetical protein LAESUDRAFT_811749 [Laetiporus sulphureus 93-53]